MLIASAVISTLSGLLLVFQRTFNFRDKYQSHQVAAKQYSDLHRDIKMTLARNHMTSEDWQRLVADITQRIAIIEDYTIPLDMTHGENEEV